MSDEPRQGWLSRYADLLYKLVLIALLGLWIAFPPHSSQPRAAIESAAQQTAESRR